MRRFARIAKDVVRLACARERLEPAPAEPPRPPAERDPHRFLRAIFTIEPLEVGEPTASSRARRSWLRWLFAPEPLPLDAEPPRVRHPSRLAALFALEPLPLDPEPPRARRRSRLAALLAPERLDDSP